MFGLGVQEILARQELIPEGHIFRGEYVSKPKHNTLTYGRVPKGNFILFDVEVGPQGFLDYLDVAEVADKMALESVPVLFSGLVKDLEHFNRLLETESCLGGVNVEGVVCKNYGMFGPDKKVLMAKHVSEHFKEIHQGEWKKTNPGSKDIVAEIIENLKTDARWEKAVQHLRDDGRLTHTPKDIGPLMAELKADLEKEAEEYVKDQLFKAFKNQIFRGATKGFPEWYKERLVEEQFDGSSGTDGTE
jgi:hypothetical protein